MFKRLLPKQELFIIDFSSQVYLDNFLISAVSSIILIRTFLSLTGYPQVGNESLHIAHMLWGGMLMMITIIGLLAFINKHIKVWSSIVGGVGFGIFADELGKFITHDNDYFFQPTFAILYLLFLVIYFTFRKVFQFIEKDEKEFVMNAVELLKEAVFYDLDANEKQKFVEYLKLSDQKHPLVKQLNNLIVNLEANPVRPAKMLQKLKMYLHTAYVNSIKSRFFARYLYLLVILGSFTNIYLVILNLVSLKFGFWEVGLTLSVLITSAVTVLGILKIIVGKTISAYMSLRTATMLSILFVQFFTFYFHQLNALIPLMTSFLAYIGIQALIEENTKTNTSIH